MSGHTLLTLKNSEELRGEWNQLHEPTRNEKLCEMTVRELVKYAAKLGLTKKHFEKYGHISGKKAVLSAIRDIFLLNKIVAQRSNSSAISSASEETEYDSDRSDDISEGDIELLEQIRREKVQLQEESEKKDQKFEEMKKEKNKLLYQAKKRFDKERAEKLELREQLKSQKRLAQTSGNNLRSRIVNLVKQTHDQDEELSSLRDELEKCKKHQRVMIEDHAAFVNQQQESSRLRKELESLRKDLERRKELIDNEQSALLRSREDQKIAFANMQKDLDSRTTECRKRKRENDELVVQNKRMALDKKNIIMQMESFVRRIKGEQYWSYTCPSGLRGVEMALWTKFKCKRLINGSVYSSDILKVNGQVPKWSNVEQVISALCANI